jgi:hypothetical protein
MQESKASLTVPAPLPNGRRRCTTTWPNGGARWWPMRWWYGLRWRKRRTWGEPEAHHGAVELVGEAGGGQEEEINDGRASGCRAHRGRLGASQLAWLGRGERGGHGGAQELLCDTPGGLNRRRQDMTRARVWYLGEKSEREKGMWCF